MISVRKELGGLVDIEFEVEDLVLFIDVGLFCVELAIAIYLNFLRNFLYNNNYKQFYLLYLLPFHLLV